MKKILLLATIAFSANVMAQESLTDITPKAYDWAHQPVGTKMVISHAVGGWNTDFTFSYTLGGSEYLVDGGCISANTGGQAADPTVYENATAVVDLGGNIGKVMCINGANSTAQEALGFTTEASINNFMQLNFFTNPDNTPRQQWIRGRIVLNIFSNAISMTDGVIKQMYFMDADNNNKHADVATYPQQTINSGQFILYDEEGDPELDEEENYIYDPNRWLTFEWDFYIMDEYKGDKYAGRTSVDMPSKWKMYMPQGGLAKSTIFIKELKFFTIDGYTDDKDEANWPPYFRAPNLVYGPCPQTEDGVNGIASAAPQRDNRIYNLAGQRMSEMQRGVNIVGGKKVVK